RHTRSTRDWSSDVCSSDLALLPEPVWGPDGAVMICSIRGFGCVEGLAPIVFAAVTAAVLGGCQTTQPTEMTASGGVAAERSAPRDRKSGVEGKGGALGDGR